MQRHVEPLVSFKRSRVMCEGAELLLPPFFSDYTLQSDVLYCVLQDLI